MPTIEEIRRVTVTYRSLQHRPLFVGWLICLVSSQTLVSKVAMYP